MTNVSKFSRDHLTGSTAERKIELTEQELNQISGGAVDAFRMSTIGSATGGAGAGKARFND